MSCCRGRMREPDTCLGPADPPRLGYRVKPRRDLLLRPSAERSRCGHAEQSGKLALEIQGAVGGAAGHVADLV